MAYYNVDKYIPIDITFNGHENRNKEVSQFKNYLIEHPECFRNAIFIAESIKCDEMKITRVNNIYFI